MECSSGKSLFWILKYSLKKSSSFISLETFSDEFLYQRNPSPPTAKATPPYLNNLVERVESELFDFWYTVVALIFILFLFKI